MTHKPYTAIIKYFDNDVIFMIFFFIRHHNGFRIKQDVIAEVSQNYGIYHLEFTAILSRVPQFSMAQGYLYIVT